MFEIPRELVPKLLAWLMGAIFVAYTVATLLFVPGPITSRDNVIFVLLGSAFAAAFGVIATGSLLFHRPIGQGASARVGFGSAGGAAGFFLFLFVWTLLGPQVRRPRPPMTPAEQRTNELLSSARDLMTGAVVRLGAGEEQAELLANDVAVALAAVRQERPDQFATIAESLRNGDAADLLTVLNQRRHRPMTELEAHRQYAAAALATWDLPLARSAIDDYLQQRPRDLEAVALRWRIAAAQEDWPAAAETLKRWRELAESSGRRSQVARVATLQGTAALEQGDVEQAEQHFTLAFRYARSLANRGIMAKAQLGLGRTYLAMDEPDDAEDVMRQALSSADRAEDRGTMGLIWRGLGDVARHRRRYDEAEKNYQKAMAIERPLNRPQEAARTLEKLGVMQSRRGDYTAARATLSRAAELNKDLAKTRHFARNTLQLAQAAERSGQAKTAADEYAAALELFQFLREPAGQAASREGLGNAAVMGQQLDPARRQWIEALRLYETVGDIEAAKRVRTALQQLGG